MHTESEPDKKGWDVRIDGCGCILLMLPFWIWIFMYTPELLEAISR